MGDPACHLSRTCLSCGRFLDEGEVTDGRCPHCGCELEDGVPGRALGMNTIIYCTDWEAVVAFYRDVLGFGVVYETDWFTELAVASGASVSVADAGRTSIVPGDGRGLTLSIRVDDLAAWRCRLAARGADPGPFRRRFGSQVFDVWDPAGNRVELWA